MNTNSSFSRRTWMRMAAGASVAVAGGAVTGGSWLGRALAQAGDTELVCNANGVRIRNRASLSGTVVGTLNAGAIVNLTGDPVSADGYSWLPITARGGAAGFAAADFFDTSQGGFGIGTDVVTTSSLNLRAAAGLGGAVIRTLPTGTHAVTRAAPIARDGFTWYGVILDDGTQGFVAGEFLEEGTGGGNNDGFPAGTPVIVADGPLNLRRSAGTGGGVIRTYATSTLATVINGPTAANGYDWYKVEIAEDGNAGWFAGDFLAVARTEPTGQRLRVVNGPLRLRENPGLNGAVLASLPNGMIVVVADASFVRQDGYLWKFVRLEADGFVEGYIADGFTEVIG